MICKQCGINETRDNICMDCFMQNIADFKELVRRNTMPVKIYHMASKIDQHGNVSALCYDKPRPIPLAKGHSWTIRSEAVTCRKCLARMKKD